MRFFVPIGLFVAVCAVLAGCAATGPQPPRSLITFDYTPPSEDNAGSAEVTFAVVGARLVTPDEKGAAALLGRQTPVPIFDEFTDNMTKDFMEVLIARGYGVRGPFKTYDDMIHPEKEGSDLVLTAEVDFSLDGSGVRYSYQRSIITKAKNGFELKGPVKVESIVNLIVYESLTNTKMWTKSIAIRPLTAELQSHEIYPISTLVTLAAKYGKMVGESLPEEGQGTPFGIPVTEFLARENQFYSDVGRVLQVQYTDILKGLYGYLDPREMDMVKNQSLELRKKKVY